jgi:hypothetical protein
MAPEQGIWFAFIAVRPDLGIRNPTFTTLRGPTKKLFNISCEKAG